MTARDCTQKCRVSVLQLHKCGTKLVKTHQNEKFVIFELLMRKCLKSVCYKLDLRSILKI